MINQVRSKTLLLATLAAGLVLAGGASLVQGAEEVQVPGKSGRVPTPAYVINTEKGDKCVQPEEVMRRDHMKFILHQRDMTMHQGIRTPRYSLKNCVDCHADPKTGSVLGQDGFCASCHRYAAVKIDCFECHSSQREASAVPAPSAARALGADAAPRNNKGKKP